MTALGRVLAIACLKILSAKPKYQDNAPTSRFQSSRILYVMRLIILAL